MDTVGEEEGRKSQERSSNVYPVLRVKQLASGAQGAQLVLCDDLEGRVGGRGYMYTYS